MRILFIFLFTLSGYVDAAEDLQIYAGKSEMSGYQFKDYVGFENKWHLVTVRYRKDTGEMRFTYANDLAWKSLLAGSVDYPDGAVFSKIGLATQDDPSFVSSATPSGARRYQFMVRNKLKHKDTGGWGYALFDANGLTFPEKPDVQVHACAACHNLVPERGFVFSQPVQLSPFQKIALPKSSGLLKLLFKTEPLAGLPASVKAILPPEIKTVRMLTGELTERIFQGTLDEIRPALSQEVIKSSMPAILLSADALKFSVVFFDPKSKSCADKKSDELDLISISSLPNKAGEVYTVKFCHSRPSLPKSK